MGEGNQTSDPYSDLRRNHGILNAVGWGILLPIGAMIARYFKDTSSWFYAHGFIQITGFFVGLAGIITGITLNSNLNVNVDRHKYIGLAVITLGCLQIIGVLMRPSNKSKSRKYWNWYHQNVGRILIILAAVNIFYGIYLADAGSEWNVTYGVFLAVLVIIALFLELRLLKKQDDC
ncbi:hypothetical protein M8C21_007477 [Ambrosia artemisiifolia]|uniref:Cytochrome b561 domain-containing protein n=1 Tax=Ambrosia artemisiifolia TaxID=4212 RepID=A0AAD5C2M3_AMBAR|nr:hypothetical protein M8C21_007477 [Ambrosia artemisiifolia]